jgi:alkylation response protein AidB-like acyl-CoA dehydrogenase
MHLVVLLNIVRRWLAARTAGDRRRATAFAASMIEIARDGVVMASAVSELGQNLTRPRTTATRTPAGWRIDGRKAFCTMSPAATVLATAVTYVDDDRIERYGYAQVPADAAGVEILDDWDALAMRASGSHSVTFTDVAIPHSALRAASSLVTRTRTWSATSSPASSTPPPRSASRRARRRPPPTQHHAATSPMRARAC